MRSRIWTPGAPHIIRGGRTREVELPIPPNEVAGFFTVDLIHSRSGLVAQHLEFPNLITDAGLDRFGGLASDGTNQSTLPLVGSEGANYRYGMQWCAVGTGNTAPAVGQTALDTEVGRTNGNGGFGLQVNKRAADNTYVYFTMTREFSEAEANGNLAEVGLFDNSTLGTLMTRQLFRDAGGNPVVVTKTSDYKLRITYEFRLYIPQVDVVTNQVVAGAATDVSVRPFYVTNAYYWDATKLCYRVVSTAPLAYETNALVSITATTPGGVAQLPDTQTQAAYVAGNHYCEYTTEYGAAKANFATGVGMIILTNSYNGSVQQSHCAFQCAFNPKIAKSNTQKLTVVWRESWARRILP